MLIIKRLKLKYQESTYDCGISSLLSILRYYKCNVTRSYLEKISLTTKEGSTMYGLMIAAKNLGFNSYGVNGTISTINNKNTPFIAHLKLKDNVFHYVIITKITPKKIIIKDFSLKVKSGQKIAIVGPTGAGKTTIVKLLMRFYPLTDGAIYIDGCNIKDFKREDYRHAFGMVLQDAWLFSGTIMDNLRYGKLDATDEEVIASAKKAHVDHFIKTLPGGYSMELNEETSNVSSGQKQLLTIARAILADPKVMILDEATSNVDTRTEVLIQEAMDELMKGRTSFIIAHRLSTIQNADVILVLNHGNIVEVGTHEELLKKKGFYYDLYNSQFEQVS